MTFSLLTQFLMCRERFRLQVIDGLKPMDQFNHKIEYGQMWHVCEEATKEGEGKWKGALLKYVTKLDERYPLQRDTIVHWYNTCLTQFDSSLRYWKSRPFDAGFGEQVLSEEVFSVSYTLPSKRVVVLKGKWDGTNLVTTDPKKRFKHPHLKLQENKTKGDIDERAIQTQLKMDLQTMLYFTALKIHLQQNQSRLPKSIRGLPLTGVLYNVVRRPFSGGKGNIVRHKAKGGKLEETETHFYARFKADYLEKEPEYWFMRWDVPITPADCAKFENEMLVPILESLLDWWEVIPKKRNQPFPVGVKHHWMSPYLYNPLSDGRQHYLDQYMESGSMTGLEHVQNLFPELS